MRVLAGSWTGRTVAIVCLAAAAGCTATGHQSPPARTNLAAPGAVGDCARLYREVDTAVAAAGVGDAQAAPVPGLPYLRINRFLAAVSPDPDAPEFTAWIDRLQALDREARRAELANLPAGPARGHWREDLERCAGLLRRHDLAQRRVRARVAATRVPDDYRTGLRVLGIYPVTSIPFMQGVRKLHRETRETFDTPLEVLPVEGTLRRLAPSSGARLSAAEVTEVLARSAHNPLAIPEPQGDDRQRLFDTFAPVWEIDTVSAADRPGQPVLPGDIPEIRGEPVIFTHLSHARWYGRTLVQLNYVIWFPARPRQGPFDLVGGHLDGITWRVTLGPDGQPLLYDSVHNCGCYHKVLTTVRVRQVAARQGREEPILVAQQVADGQGRVVLRIAATSHYLQRAYRRTPGADGTRYRLDDYDRLRTLPLPTGGRRSLFRPDGIVPGTERRERWLFWPMGVPEPGAMRQWGNHAIAFVGRRHFDDPGLLQRYFAAAEAPGTR